MIQELVATRYKVLDKIGTGGAAVVYRAHDTRLDRTVALKVLRDELATDPQFLERFEREARLAARLTHPNLVAVHDYGSYGDTAFIAMEYVDGESLKARVRRLGRLSPDEALRITRQLLAGLSVAHASGLVHRDVKPQNVLLGRDGTVKLVDFGIAQTAALAALTQTGTTMGTAAYMAPEQVQGTATGPATDVYAIGAVLYEMLTGRPPFEGGSPIEVALRHLNDTPTPPSAVVEGIPPELDAAVMRALAKDPSERFASAETMAAALGGELADSFDATATMPALEMDATAALPRMTKAADSSADESAEPLPVAAAQPVGQGLAGVPWREWVRDRRRASLAAAGLAALLIAGLVAAGGMPELRFTRRSAAVSSAVTGGVASQAATVVPMATATPEPPTPTPGIPGSVGQPIPTPLPTNTVGSTPTTDPAAAPTASSSAPPTAAPAPQPAAPAPAPPPAVAPAQQPQPAKPAPAPPQPTPTVAPTQPPTPSAPTGAPTQAPAPSPTSGGQPSPTAPAKPTTQPPTATPSGPSPTPQPILIVVTTPRR